MDDAERLLVARLARVRAEVRAPEGLRTRIEAARPIRRSRGTRRAAYGGALAAGLAVIVLGLVLILPGGTPGAPSLSQAAALGALVPTAGAPAPDNDHPDVQLGREVERVYFPNWTSLHWRAVGQRVDHVGGRLALTVYYQWHGHRIAYTIVSAPELKQPPATPVSLNGVDLRTLKLDNRTIVTWRRAGHTCILSSATADAATMRELAAWHGASASSQGS
jgi:hypothetical protein